MEISEADDGMIHAIVSAKTAVRVLIDGIAEGDASFDAVTGNGDASDRITITYEPRHSGRIEGRHMILSGACVDDEDAQDRYTSGGCAAFAHALWLAHGRPSHMGIGVLMDEDEEPHSDEFPHCYTHVYLETPDGSFDVMGERTPHDMAETFFLQSWTTDGPHDPEEFRRTFTGRGDEPLYCDEDDVAHALSHILRNPDRYGIAHKGEKA